MSLDRAHRIEAEIAEIFDSKNEEWITAISMIVDVMHQEFIRERQESTNKDGMLEKVVVVGDANLIRGHRRRLSRLA